MNLFKKLFGNKSNNNVTMEKNSTPSNQSNSKSEFPEKFIGRVTRVIINYEGVKDSELQEKVVKRLLPLAAPGCGFHTYCNASIQPLEIGEPNCGLIQISGGFPKAGVSLDSYMAYVAEKDSLQRDYSMEQIGYWIGTENNKQVHAIILL
jgi:hypothetical protein